MADGQVDLRKTGISVVGNIAWGSHFCHFYETKQDLLDILIPYFKAGLETGEFCLWVVSDSLGKQEALKAFRESVPDADKYLKAGQIEIIAHTDWYLTKGPFDFEFTIRAWTDKLSEALATGYAGMRVNGDTSWLSREDWQEFSEYERNVNEAFYGQEIILVCSYPLVAIAGTEVFDVMHTHQFAIARRYGQWAVIETPELEQAKAEIRRLNEDLQRLLERTPEPRAILSYLPPVLSVTAALAISLWLATDMESSPHVSLLLCAVMLSAWYGGVGPGVFAITLSLFATAYILPPADSLSVETRELPRLFLFLLSALLVGGLSVAQRRTAESLRRARDIVHGTVQKLTLTNQSLREEIADRRRVEGELKKEKEILQKIVDHIPVMLNFTDSNGKIGLVNREWEKTLGWSLQEIRDKNIDIFAECYPDPVYHQSVIEFLRATSGEWKDLRTRVRDGHIIDTSWVTVSLADGTKLGIGQDVTERRRAEQSLRLFRTLLDQSHDAIEVIDPDTLRFLDCNKSAHENLGYSREEFLSLTVHDIDPLITEESNVRASEEMTQSGFVMFDSIHRRKDGSTFPVEVNLRIVHLERDYRLAVVRDITERKRTEDRLRATSDQLRALSASLESAREEEGTRIAREVHDELGATLSSLRWDLEDLDESISETADQSRLPEMRKKIEAMMRLTDSTIDTVRRIASELRPIALDALGLAEAIELQAKQFQARTGIAVECDGSLENVDLRGEESTAIFRIFQEALTNVLRHAQATNVDIMMRADAGEFILTIGDNGRGITDEEKSSARTLGILGMRERANLIGGEIDFTVAGGAGGTIVTVRMPLSR